MKLLVGILSFIIVILVILLRNYQRQVENICRQLSFLMEHDSNMMLETQKGTLGKLVDMLNEWLKLRRKEKNAYQKKEKMISDTYTNLSHDIRTPLTSLDGYFQLMENSEDAEEQRRYLKIIQERISSLKELLEELFTFTKLKNDTFELELTSCCISKILKNTIFSYYDEWSSRGLEPQIRISEQPLYIEGNEQALRRIFQNVIKNGLEHGEKEISISLFQHEEQVVFRVENKVEAPEKIDVSQVFERFYKADAARSKTSTGLGLSIAKEFVLRMNGSIHAELDGSLFLVEAVFPMQ